MISTGNEGGGFTYYDWPLPNDETQIEPTVTYAKTAPEWDWVINASTYMIDFNASANEILQTILLVTGIRLVVGIVGVWIFVSRSSRLINEVAERMTSDEQ